MTNDQTTKLAEKYSNTSRPAYGLGGSTELLKQIAAPDIKEEKEKEKKRKKPTSNKSISDQMILLVMRSTLFFDLIKRNNKRVFQILTLLWGIFISLVYAGGITMILTINYSRIHFKTIVERYLQKHELRVDNLEVTDSTLSQIKITNVRDKNRTYNVRTVNLYSTFGDFLRKKVHRIEFDKVTVRIKDTGTSVELSPLFPLLLNLNNQHDINIDSIVIKNAVLEVEGKEYTIPITFSLDAQLNTSNKMNIPLRIKDDTNNIMAHLTITRNGNTLDWSITDLKGSTDFLSKQLENVSGSLSFKTRELTPFEFKAKTVFSLGDSSKEISADLKGENKIFNGNVTFLEKTKIENKDTVLTDIGLKFDKLTFKSFSNFVSDKNLSLNIKKLNTPSLEINGLETNLNGSLSCINRDCTYQLLNKTSVDVKDLKYTSSINTYKNSQPVKFTLLPQKEMIKYNPEKTMFTINAQDLYFSGKKENQNKTIDLSSKSFLLGTDSTDPKTVIAFSAQGLNFKNPTQEIKDAHLYIKDIQNPQYKFSLNTPNIQFFDNTVVKKPFALNIQSEDGKAQAKALFADGKIQANFSGAISLNNGIFIGTLFVPTFKLEDIENPAEISSLFPENISNLTGKVSLYGNIDWKNENQISGPLYLSLKDINFTKGNSTVKNLNSVLALQSLQPFVSQSTQLISIDEIQAAIPLQNIRSSVKFENQQMRIFSLTGSFADIELTADNQLINYKSNLTHLYFRNGSVNWKDINPYLKTDGLTVDGTGSMYIPFEVTPDSIVMRNAEAKLINTTLSYTGSNPELKENFFTKNNEYIIRSGTISMDSKENGVIDTNINIEGREKNETERNFYRTNKVFNFDDLFKKELTKPTPPSILQLQEQLSAH